MTIPISHNGNKNLADTFYKILTFHVPLSKEKSILDPTCGRRYIWAKFLTPKYQLFETEIPIKQYNKVVFGDIRDFGYNIVSDIKDLSFNQEFDCIVYDPPYIFGCDNSTDARREDYGDYVQSYDQLLWFMDIANEKFPKWLKPNGKLILKCSDQYNVKERKFYPHHITWVERLTNFNIIDFYIFIQHGRLNPTAFQVKNRESAVIMHSYFMVFKLK